VEVIDGLSGGDFSLLTDDVRRDAGGKSAVRFQVESGPAHDGVMGKAEIFLIGLTDPEDDAPGVREHHVIG
jgi:hypothetical protein